MYRVSHLKGALLWSCVQGRVFNTFSWFISQIKGKGCANRYLESHLWCCHFWRENSNVCYNSLLQTIRIQMRHFWWIWLLMLYQAKYYDFKATYRAKYSKIVCTISQRFIIIKNVSFWFLLFAARYCSKHLNFRAKNGSITNVILPIDLHILWL